MGDVFILIGQNNSGSTRRLVKLSSDCFVLKVKCPHPETISAFPEDYSPYNWADMHWSPNGKFMFFVDHRFNEAKSQYLDELMLYNAQHGEIKKVISGYKYISDITWNPNNKWAAMAVKKLTDEDMQIVLVSPNGELLFPLIKHASEAGYTPHIFNGQVFDNNQHPVQWLNENELIFSRTRGEATTNPNELPILPVTHFFKFNIQTNEEGEIDLPTRGYYHFSPNGSFAHFEENQIQKIYDFESGKILELSDFGLGNLTNNWSPDSKYLVACQKGPSTYIITPDLKKKQKIIDGCSFYPIWMPDSDHIILFIFSHEDNGKIIESHWYVASVAEGSVKEITIPDFSLVGKNVNGIYVQPVKFSE